MAKPFLRWAGSKRQLLSRLVEFWPGGDATYIEPFAGSAHLFFALEPRSAVLGDTNSGLMEVYEIVRDKPRALHEALGRWTNDESQYYEVRALDLRTLCKTDRAARLVYLNRYCYNGLYRTNGKGHFNVPYGGKKSGNLPSLSDLKKASLLLARAELVTADFAETVQNASQGDFIYLDPPFSVQSRRVFREYGPVSFGLSDLKRMRDTLQHLDELGATFLLSYAYCPEGQTLASGFRQVRVATTRRIASSTGSRGIAQELLITNVATHQMPQEPETQ